MVSWNLPTRLVGRKAPLRASGDCSDSSSQQDINQAPRKQELTVRRDENIVSRTRKCQFDLTRSTIHPHIHLDDLSEEEFVSMWVSAEEFMEAKKEYVAVVRKMMNTVEGFPETEDFCPRGLGTFERWHLLSHGFLRSVLFLIVFAFVSAMILEFKTKDGARRRKKSKQRACFTVLEEQDIQRDEGVFDPEFLSEVYKEMSGQSSLEALNRGLKDQKVMLELLDDEERMKWEQQKTPTKGNSVLEVPTRRRSVTEKLNGADMLQARRTVAA